MQRLRKAYDSRAYSIATGYLLNIFSLNIRDKNIADKIYKRQYERFNKIFWHCTVANFLGLLYHIVLFI